MVHVSVSVLHRHTYRYQPFLQQFLCELPEENNTVQLAPAGAVDDGVISRPYSLTGSRVQVTS